MASSQTVTPAHQASSCRTLQREQWQGVALGIAAFTAQELADLWNPDGGGWLPEQWLTAWREALSGGRGGGES